MDSDELARATAAGLGGDVVAATEGALSGERARAFGVGEAVAIGGMVVSLAQVAVAWYRAGTERQTLIAGLLKDELASGAVSKQKREQIVGRLADQLLGAPKSDALVNAKRDFLRAWAAAESNVTPADVPRGFRRPVSADTPRKFLAAPALVPFADQDYWYLERAMTWASAQTKPPEVTVPKGFVTDFASIPQAFWIWLPRIGRYGLPAIAHDWLYWEQSGSRKEADELLDAAMGELRVAGLQRSLIYRAVRLFGGFAWDGNSKRKSTGEKRILQQTPPAASISWSEWRGNAGVFQ